MPELPPTHYLILEVLAARHRLGEHHWTFPSRFGPYLASLERSGFISYEPAVTDGDVRVTFTDFGRSEWLSGTYQPPATADTDLVVLASKLRDTLADLDHVILTKAQELFGETDRRVAALLDTHPKRENPLMKPGENTHCGRCGCDWPCPDRRALEAAASFGSGNASA